MQSLITPQFICGTFLLLVAIGEARYDSTCSKCHKKSNPKVVRIIPPVEQTEGPHWDPESKKLYYVQTMGQKLCRYDPVTGETTYAYIDTAPVGTAVPVKGEPNKFLVSAGQNFVLVTWNPSKNETNPKIEIFATVENVTGTHLNDGKADTHGRFWAGTMGPLDPTSRSGIRDNQGAFYRLTGNGVVKTMIKPVTISNGLAWTWDDKTMYYVDTATRAVAAYDFDAERGEICNRRIVFDLTGEYNKTAHTNSITIDRCGCIYATMYDGSRVIKIDPFGGTVLESFEMPTSKITSLAWGGDKFDVLYVTTSSFNVDATKDSIAGSVLAVYGLEAQGFEANQFSLDRHDH